MFRSAARPVVEGAISLSNSMRLVSSSGCTPLKPVMLPPGRARLSTTSSGSPTIMTAGMVRVARLTASAAGVPRAMIRSGLTADHFGHKAGVERGIAVCGPIVQDKIAPLDVSKLFQTAPQGSEVGRVELRRCRLDHCNTVGPAGRLCLCCELWRH